jgi:hypothetical protein
MTKELVVARYNEELNWLKRVPNEFRVVVYDKGEAPAPGATVLPNIGREAHTYLHHIVTRYDVLADATVFCQGKPFDHAFDFHKSLRALATNEFGDFVPFGHIVDTDDAQGRLLFTRWSKNDDGRELDMRGFHRALFGNDGPGEYTFRLGAQFAITRDLIRRRPRDFYERALRVSVDFPDAAHCFERSWPLVFGVENPDLQWLNGAKTAYLKPIHRLINKQPTES